MSIETTINALLNMHRIKCNRCGAAMIIRTNSDTIVKCRLMVISIIKGDIEIKCRECGQLKIICSN